MSMKVISVDYLGRDRVPGVPDRYRLHRAWGLHLTRPLLWCRLFGHRSRVDGYGPTKEWGNSLGHVARWVVCDRCGLRPHPQGNLDPDRWSPDDPYPGPWSPAADTVEQVDGWPTPGPYPTRDEGVLGVELVIGRRLDVGVGGAVKIGHGGSEHTTAVHLHLGVAALYLHTERIGEWWVRRLNRHGRESRLVELRVRLSEVRWRLWAPRERILEPGVPGWRDGSVSLRLLDRILGPRLYEYTDLPGGKVSRVLRLPEADYLITLRLQRVIYGRRRGRQRPQPYHVDWVTAGPGIPTTGPLRGRCRGGPAVTVSDRAVYAGTWPAEAVAAITMQIATRRTEAGWEPTGKAPVQVEVAA